MLRSIWFVLGICVILVLCFFSEIVMDSDGGYTILQVLQNMSRSQMAQEPQLMLPVALRNAFSGYVTLFVPIISALPMVQILHIESGSGYKRFYMSRRSYGAYYRNKWLAGMLSAALMLMIAAVFFQVFMALSFPNPAAEMLKMLGYTSGTGLFALGRTYIGIFVYGAFSVIPAIVISSFTDNFYFVLCLPFLFSYFWDIAISAIAKFIRAHQEGSMLAGMVEGLFSRAYLSIAESGWDFLLETGRGVLLLFLLLLIYVYYLKGKRDYGE